PWATDRAPSGDVLPPAPPPGADPDAAAGAGTGCVGSHISNQRRSHSSALRPETDPSMDQPRRASDQRRSVSPSNPTSTLSARTAREVQPGWKEMLSLASSRAAPARL